MHEFMFAFNEKWLALRSLSLDLFPNLQFEIFKPTEQEVRCIVRNTNYAPGLDFVSKLGLL